MKTRTKLNLLITLEVVKNLLHSCEIPFDLLLFLSLHQQLSGNQTCQTFKSDKQVKAYSSCELPLGDQICTCCSCSYSIIPFVKPVRIAFALPLLAYINVLATPCHTDNMHVEIPSYLSRPMRHLTLAVALMAVFVTREAASCVQRICICIFHFPFLHDLYNRNMEF